MDGYQPRRMPVRDREQQPTRLSRAPARSHAWNQGQSIYGHATAAGQTVDGGDRQTNAQPMLLPKVKSRGTVQPLPRRETNPGQTLPEPGPSSRYPEASGSA